MSGRRSQRGQSMVFLLGVTASLIGAFLLTYNSGQVHNHKARLINASDAAAYSGATWQARALNFQSYMNRAMVANEVAIGQSVSMRSWLEYMDRNLENLSTVSSWIPYVNAVTRALSRIWDGLNRAMQPILGAAELAVSGLNQVLSAAQVTVHTAGFIASRDIADQTLRAHGPDVRPSSAQNALLVPNSAAWERLTAYYDRNERTRNRNVVMDSRDGFTRERSHNINVVVRLAKRGGTELMGFDEWRGMDTMSLHIRRYFFAGRFREVSPLGWGGAQNFRGRENRRRGDHGRTYADNRMASQLADQTRRRNPFQQRTYLGLAPTRDIQNFRRRDDLTLDFAVEAQRAGTSIATSESASSMNVGESVMWRNGAANHRANLHRGNLYSLSQAEVYWMRPEARRDSRREYPSLYNPYWQVRLAQPNRASRIAASSAKGLVADPFIATP
jgi:hypothetical protein